MDAASRPRLTVAALHFARTPAASSAANATAALASWCRPCREGMGKSVKTSSPHCQRHPVAQVSTWKSRPMMRQSAPISPKVRSKPRRWFGIPDDSRSAAA